MRGEPEAIPIVHLPDGVSPLYYAKDNNFEAEGVRLNIQKGLLAKKRLATITTRQYKQYAVYGL